MLDNSNLNIYAIFMLNPYFVIACMIVGYSVVLYSANKEAEEFMKASSKSKAWLAKTVVPAPVPKNVDHKKVVYKDEFGPVSFYPYAPKDVWVNEDYKKLKSGVIKFLLDECSNSVSTEPDQLEPIIAILTLRQRKLRPPYSIKWCLDQGIAPPYDKQINH